MLRRVVILAVAATCWITGCASRKEASVEALSGSQDVSAFTLQSLRGTRDGDRLTARAVFGDGNRSLDLDLLIQVTPPSRLESGTWKGMGGSGTVRERSLTFLGGQNASPSVGGSFELSGADGKPLYNVRFPVQQLKDTL